MLSLFSLVRLVSRSPRCIELFCIEEFCRQLTCFLPEYPMFLQTVYANCISSVIYKEENKNLYKLATICNIYRFL